MSLNIIIQYPLEDTLDQHYETDNVHAFMFEHFPEGIKTAKLYHEQVAIENEIHFNSEKDIKAFGELSGVLYIVKYPGAQLLVNFIISTVINVALTALTAPDTPEAARNTRAESPNEQLGERTNGVRLGGAIPWPVGANNVTPDLLMNYTIYENHIEKEVSCLLVGVGEYDIDATKVFDDQTRISEIQGASVEVWKPFTSPLSGDAPQLRIGQEIEEGLYVANRYTAINGQTLRAPNEADINGDVNIKFVAPNKVVGNLVDFNESFAVGGKLIVENAEFEDFLKSTEVPAGDGEVREESAQSAVRNMQFNNLGQIEFETNVPSFIDVGKYIVISNAQFLSIDLVDGSTINLTGNIDVDFTTETAGNGDLSINSDVVLTDSSIVVDLSGVYRVNAISGLIVTLDNPSSVNTDWNLITGNFVDDKTPLKFCRTTDSRYSRKINLDGIYDITAINAAGDEITLDNPVAINDNWGADYLTSYIGNETSLGSPILSSGADKTVGPFTVLPYEPVEKIIVNIVATNGLYKFNGQKQQAFNIEFEVELTPVDADGNATGAPQIEAGVIRGSSSTKGTRAVTLQIVPNFTGDFTYKVRRTTDTDYEYEGTVIDEIKAADVYVMGKVDRTDFGDVTLLTAVTLATNTALSIKDRKLNLDAVSVFDGVPTQNAGDIIKAITLHPAYGNRSIDTLDMDNINATIATIDAYFGTSKASEFSYTFSSDNMSYEEMIYTIANCIYCEAYRLGDVLKLSFEHKQDVPKLLFNHRNKIPESETRTEIFGIENDYDGVTLEWKNPDTRQIETLSVPEGQYLYNPKKVEVLGIHNAIQAHFHIYRAWNKLNYHKTSITFDGLEETNLLVNRDYILIADNARPETQDGHIEYQDGLCLTLSQPLKSEQLTGDDYIFLQLSDATVESIKITPVEGNDCLVMLANAPRLSLITDCNQYLQTTYQIVSDTNKRMTDFMVRNIDKQDLNQASIEAINIDPRYWQNDTDFINNVITE